MRLIPRIFLFLTLLFLFVHINAREKNQHVNPSKEEIKNTSIDAKKGVGLVESSGFGDSQLNALHVAWYYNWNYKTNIHASIEYVPMIFSTNSTDAAVKVPILLGYNEPDNPKQSNISVEKALLTWPILTSKAQRIGSPAMAGNPVTGNWLSSFMQENPKVDFITVHWYKGPSAEKFTQDIETICNTYKKPVWVTEFAPQTVSESKEKSTKYSQQEVNQFIQKAVAWMNRNSCVERFAWHDSKVGTSALFNESGTLTETGKTYANAK